jgi:hypothetical protein
MLPTVKSPPDSIYILEYKHRVLEARQCASRFCNRIVNLPYLFTGLRISLSDSHSTKKDMKVRKAFEFISIVRILQVSDFPRTKTNGLLG